MFINWILHKNTAASRVHNSNTHTATRTDARNCHHWTRGTRDQYCSWTHTEIYISTDATDALKVESEQDTLHSPHPTEVSYFTRYLSDSSNCKKWQKQLHLILWDENECNTYNSIPQQHHDELLARNTPTGNFNRVASSPRNVLTVPQPGLPTPGHRESNGDPNRSTNEASFAPSKSSSLHHHIIASINK